MLRQGMRKGLAGLLAALCGWTSQMALADTPSDPCTESVRLQSKLVETSRHTALEYDASLSGSEMLARVRRDCEALSLPIVKTLAAGRVVVVEADRETVAARLAAAERIPVARLAPVYLTGGSLEPATMVVMTSRLLLSFDPSASEAAKHAWLADHGFRLVRETERGRLIVETGRSADVAMVSYAADLQASAPLLSEARFEFLLTAEQTAASDSVILDDPFYRFQWPLFNAGDNTNANLGKIDEDIDVGRAWMFNQRNVRDAAGQFGKGTFGDPALVVAVFDSGTELNHVDLAQSIDSRIGSDYVDSGSPTPPPNALGAHGTAVAGLIVASANQSGIVGAAPGVKLFSMRVLAPDNSASNVSLRTALEETISKDIDVNVHPYTLAVDIPSGLVGDVELGLRQAYESGRDAIGLPNLAATGNFFGAVEYPAASKYSIAVSSVSSEGGQDLGANWGGVGADIVGPSYALTDQQTYSAQRGTGVVTTDLTGNTGLASQDSGTPGNESGAWAAVGFVEDFTETATADSVAFQGTSVAVAHMGGVLALMMSDNRFDELAPMEDPGPSALAEIHRTQRRNRGPRYADNLLSQLRAHSDLPSDRFDGANPLSAVAGFSTLPNVESLTYIDQYNEFLASGRPNPARFTAVNPDTSEGAASGVATPDSFFTSLLQRDEDGLVVNVYAVQFGEEGPGRLAEDPVPPELANDWTIENQVLGGQIPSPYLEGVKALYFEDGTTRFPINPSKFLYVWTDTVTTGTPEQAASEAEDPRDGVYNLANPQGRYFFTGRPSILSPIVVPPEGSAGQPMVLTMQLAHGLGVQNASARFGQEGSTPQILPEVDRLQIEMNIFDQDGNERTVSLAALTGDSWHGRKPRVDLAAPVSVANPAPARNEPQWQGGTVEYRPYVTNEQMIIRTYRFLMPPVNEEESFQIRLRLAPAGNSYLPEYKYDQNGDPIQTYNTRWDDKGFILYSAKVNILQRSALEYLTATNFALDNSSRRPTWSASMNDAFFVQDLESSADARVIAVADTRPDYLSADRTSVLTKPSQKMLRSNERITGLKGHPGLDVLAMTTDDGEAQYLYVLTTDGLNQKQLVNPQVSSGARDPNWAVNGRQLIYAGPSYIRIVSILSDVTAAGELPVNVETVISSDRSNLEDFHNPVFDFAGGNVIFTARRKDDGSNPDRSLQLYVCTRNGRVISYSSYSECPEGPSRGGDSPFLYGWDNIDLYDLDLSVSDPGASSGRLLFVANASSAPVPPPNCSVETDVPVAFSPAVPSSAAFIYSIDNFNNVMLFNDAPQYSLVSLSIPNPAFTASARYPRISPDRRELLFTAYDQPVGQQSDANGLIVRQALAAEPNTAPVNTIRPNPPTPTPPPTSRPPIVPEGRVAYTAQSLFLVSQEGWEFRTGGAGLDAPRFTFVQGGTGSLRLEAQNSRNTFGYMESARGTIQAREGSLHLFRAYMRSTTTSAAAAPSVRLRVNSSNLESAFTADTNSRGDLSLSPNNARWKHFDLLFRPPAGLFDQAANRQNYTAAIDLLNFFADDDLNAGVEIDKIEIFRLDEAGKYFALWSFTANASGTISLNAVSSGAAEGELSMALRRCCSDASTDVACTAGSSVAGAALSNIPVEAGRTYTVVVAGAFAQPVELLWDSTVDLTAAPANGCGVSAVGCAISVPIAGQSGSNTQQTIFLGRGQAIPAPSCSTDENRTVVSRMDTIYDANFADPAVRAKWRPGPDPNSVTFQNPEFLQVDNSLALRVVNRSNTFGYWSAAGSTIPAGTVVPSDDAPYVVYRARFSVANPYETNGRNVPDIRVRLATNDFQRSVSASLVSVLQGSTVPVPDKPRNVELYLVLEAVPTGFSSFVAGFDVLSFYPGRQITAQPMELKSLQIERLYIPDYPLPR